MACSCQKSRRDCLISNIGSYLPLQTSYGPEHPATVQYHPYRASGLVHGRGVRSGRTVQMTAQVRDLPLHDRTGKLRPAPSCH
ncbi:protein of unknown function [Denitratisoma oestradiolicum]|uniref:Uncharacterized protein n=1 Tax=Denitratisoma oestradiolicum TaxID=311182 RepID=A0A6S6XY80_9PROT|nr:protein of unknown function [Denitratisoma oestradiolicum]